MSKTRSEPAAPIRAGFLIHDVSRLRRTAYDQILKPMGITRSQWWVLATLSRHDSEGFTQIELARLLDVGKVTLGGLIDRLASNGLVTRQEDKHDRRSKRVLMSAKGKTILKTLEAVGVGVNARIMDGITNEQQAQLIQILSKMKGNLIGMDAAPGATSWRKIKVAAVGKLDGDTAHREKKAAAIKKTVKKRALESA